MVQFTCFPGRSCYLAPRLNHTASSSNHFALRALAAYWLKPAAMLPITGISASAVLAPGAAPAAHLSAPRRQVRVGCKMPSKDSPPCPAVRAADWQTMVRDATARPCAIASSCPHAREAGAPATGCAAPCIILHRVLARVARNETAPVAGR